MKFLCACLFMMLSLSCYADVFMQTDSQGNITFSDIQLGGNSQRLTQDQIKKQSVISSKPTPPVKNVQPVTVEPSAIVTPKKAYITFKIAEPTNQATIHNQPTIPVSLTVDPALQSGDSIQVYIDGRAWGSAQPSTRFDLPAPDRGTHQISATLFNENLQPIKKSDSVTVYIHQAHIPNPPAG